LRPPLGGRTRLVIIKQILKHADCVDSLPPTPLCIAGIQGHRFCRRIVVAVRVTNG